MHQDFRYTINLGPVLVDQRFTSLQDDRQYVVRLPKEVRGKFKLLVPSAGQRRPDFSRAIEPAAACAIRSRFRRRQKTSWDPLRNERSRLVLLMLQRH